MASMNRLPQPWRLIGERSSRDFHVFRTRTLDVADPRNGAAFVRTVIEAPDWVNVIPMTAEGEVVLIRQFRFGSWANELEIPGGMMEPGEDPAEAAARELEEETGYRAASLHQVGICRPNPALFDNQLFCFVARDCVRVNEGRPDAGEDIRVELFQKREIADLVQRGEISHALVLAALLFEALR